MKSTYAVLATILLFPLALLAQHGSPGSAGGGASSSSSAGSYSSSSSSSSSASHASSSGGSSVSSGSSASRGSSSSNSSASRTSAGADSHSSATQHGVNGAHNFGSGQSKTNLIQSSESNAKGRPTPATASAGKDKGNVKRSWLPWRRHSDKLAQKGDGGEKKPKCKDGKPCKEESKLAPVDENKLKCIHGPCKVCPSGFSLNSKGVCVSAPQSTAYNCPPGSFNTGQAAGQPCTSSLTQNNCSLLASQIQQEEKTLSSLDSARRPVCAQDSADQECLDLTSRYELELERLQALQEQYQACSRR